MKALESQLHYPHEDTLPPPGSCIEVAPGVKWLRTALPFELDHINLWLLRDAMDGVQGWSVVDTGIHADSSKANWETIFANELEGLPILRVIVTHMHPDHIGLADWMCERWNAPLWISASEYLVARLACMGMDAFSGEATVNFYAAHGLNDPKTARRLMIRSNYFQTLVPSVPAQYHRLQDHDCITVGDHQWQCIAGYGHSYEHMALYCKSLGVLIGGDMLLPRISTNVGVYVQEPEANALKGFLQSIDRFLPLPEDTLVLPSHGRPFTGLHIRVQQLHAHHRERLSELLTACTERPHSAADALGVLFKRPLDFHQTTFALGESVAHLHALWRDGLVHRQRDEDGVYRFGVEAK
jgi:glyoxylase-like metal-dependent hydrolase (beta-lactamase superfamily II)